METNNMNIRARFEEIWPVPDLVEWSKVHGMYAPTIYVTTSCDAAKEHNARLDTFTRCQETTDVYVSLISELIEDIESLADWANSTSEKNMVAGIVDRAKQILGREK
jgi:hypothetical protein